MTVTLRRYRPKFKAKVAVEAIRGETDRVERHVGLGSLLIYKIIYNKLSSR